MEVDDVVPAEIKAGEHLEVPKDPLWDCGEAVPGQYQGGQAPRKTFQVKCLYVRDLVVCKISCYGGEILAIGVASKFFTVYGGLVSKFGFDG